MDEVNFREIADKFNEVRENFEFPTTKVAWTLIRDLFNMYPELANMDEETMLKRIGIEVYELAFG